MHLTTKRWACFAAALVALGGCTLPPPAPTKTGLDRIEHIVVIYAENRSFDNLYGLFPGANGIANATPAQYTQVDNDGRPLRDAAAGVEGQGSRSGVSTRSAQPAVSHRCAADQPAAVDSHARSRPRVLPQPGADRRRPQRSLRRRERRRRADDGLLRRLAACRCGSGRSNTRWPTISSWGRSAARI